jgi:hypothetical protein
MKCVKRRSSTEEGERVLGRPRTRGSLYPPMTHLGPSLPILGEESANVAYLDAVEK